MNTLCDNLKKDIAGVRLQGHLQASASEIDILDCGDHSTYDYPLSECKIHDRLQARVLLIKNAREEVLWISTEECTFRKPHAAVIYKLLEEHAGLSRERVFLTAIHNHSAHSYSHFDPECFADKLLKALAQLRSDLRPLKGIEERVGTAPSGTMVNRRLKTRSVWGDIAVTNNRNCVVDMKNDRLDASGWLIDVLEQFNTTPEKEGLPSAGHTLDGPLDRRLHLWTLLDAHDEPIACICRVNTHPVSVSIAMVGPVISADYVRPLTDRISREYTCPCLVINGALGNVRPLQSAYNFSECNRIGRAFADAMLAGTPNTAPVQDMSGAACIARLPVKGLIPPTRKACKEQLVRLKEEQTALPPAEAKQCMEKIRALESAARSAPPRGTGFLLGHEFETRRVDFEVKAWSLGPIRLICFPGEPFVQQARAVEKECGSLVVGLSGGYVSYLPDPESFLAGGYESWQCILGSETLGLLPGIGRTVCKARDC